MPISQFHSGNDNTGVIPSPGCQTAVGNLDRGFGRKKRGSGRFLLRGGHTGATCVRPVAEQSRSDVA
jgi:hypothetical protein